MEAEAVLFWGLRFHFRKKSAASASLDYTVTIADMKSSVGSRIFLLVTYKPMPVTAPEYSWCLQPRVRDVRLRGDATIWGGEEVNGNTNWLSNCNTQILHILTHLNPSSLRGSLTVVYSH